MRVNPQEIGELDRFVKEEAAHEVWCAQQTLIDNPTSCNEFLLQARWNMLVHLFEGDREATQTFWDSL